MGFILCFILHDSDTAIRARFQMASGCVSVRGYFIIETVVRTAWSVWGRFGRDAVVLKRR
ncbi:hypothetical protein [Neisseria sp.]|uniref:hypothetical protein n=1 Tax=Neisseria sp. TaxID=192066 RepID=UPI00359F9A24